MLLTEAEATCYQETNFKQITNIKLFLALAKLVAAFSCIPFGARWALYEALPINVKIIIGQFRVLLGHVR